MLRKWDSDEKTNLYILTFCGSKIKFVRNGLYIIWEQKFKLKNWHNHYGQNAELKNVIIQSLIFKLKYLKADVHQFFGVFLNCY